MNTDSVSLRRVPNPLPPGHDVQPGDFSWSDTRDGGHRYLYICLPGDKFMSALRVHPTDRGIEREWQWDGNEEKPTLSPSIHCPGLWHGYLRAGRLESC